MPYFNDQRYRGRDRAERKERVKIHGKSMLLPLFPEDCSYEEVTANEDWCDQRREISQYEKMRLAVDEIVFVYDGSGEGEDVPANSNEIEFYVAVTCRFEVCPACEGRGSHVNPSIDDRGITSSEWAEWDEDDRETYISGGYDVSCYECGGQRVVSVPDLEHASEAVRIHVERMERDEELAAREDAEDRTTRWHESGCPE